MEIRQAYLATIKSFPGGWDGMCGALGMTRAALENRIYETKGQSVLVETAMSMAALSGTTHFAEAVAIAAGGTFVSLPAADDVDGECLHAKFQELYVELGRLSHAYTEATRDGEIDLKERADLTAIANELHKTM